MSEKTLLDEFAAAALSGLLARIDGDDMLALMLDGKNPMAEAIKQSYQIAGGMMAMKAKVEAKRVAEAAL